MKKLLRSAFPLLLTFSLAIAPPGSRAEIFHEDFDDTAYRDPVYTSALWDTTAGELRLPPYEMRLRGKIKFADNVAALAVDGAHAYVGITEFHGFQVVDISDPDDPRIVGGIFDIQYCTDIELSGDIAFLGAHDQVHVIDIADPSAPLHLTKVPVLDWAAGFALAGDHLYVANMNAGLTVLDVSDPLAPTIVANIDLPATAFDLVLEGDHAYVLCGYYGLCVVDIGEPAAPVLVGGYETPDHAQDVAVAGDLAYLTDTDGGLLVLDVSTPAEPLLVGQLPLDGGPCRLALAGDHAYVCMPGDIPGRLLRVDISDPTAPAVAAEIETPGVPVFVQLAGEHAFVSVAWEGLQVVKVCDSVPPRPRGFCETPGQAHDIEFAGNYAFVADGWSGIAVLDVSDPAAPAYVAQLDTDDVVLDLAVAGNHLYLTDRNVGLKVADISDPLNPLFVAATPALQTAECVTVAGDLAFVSDWYGGFAVFDISDPTDPQRVGWTSTDGNSQGMVVRGDQLFLSDGFSGLKIFDVGDPKQPTLIGAGGETGYTHHVAVAGDYAYLPDAGWDLGRDRSGLLRVYDVSDPTHPTEVALLYFPGDPGKILLSGDTIVMATEQHLAIIDISAPTNPTLRWLGDIAHFPWGTALAGDYVWLCEFHWGVEVVQVFDRFVDPEANVGQSLTLSKLGEPAEYVRLTSAQVGTIAWELSADGGGSWQSIVPDGHWLHLAHPGDDLRWRATLLYDESGLNPTVDELVLEWAGDVTSAAGAPPPVLALRAPQPNPFNPATTIRFDVPAGAAFLRLTVHDPRGRHVRTLARGALPAGPHAVTWDGRDEGGRRLASGVYTARLARDGRVLARKLVLLK